MEDGVQELVRAAKLWRMFPDDPKAVERLQRAIDEWELDDDS